MVKLADGRALEMPGFRFSVGLARECAFRFPSSPILP